MEPIKGKSSTRCREGKRDVHLVPTKKDAYARLLGQHQSIKFKSYLEQFAQPTLLIEDSETSPPCTAACPPDDRKKEEARKRAPSFTECADSSGTAPPRHNKHDKCASKPSRQGQSPVGRKTNQENWREVRPALDALKDLGEGSHQGVKLLCEDLNYKGRPNTDEDMPLGPKFRPKSQQTPENDLQTRKDPCKKKSRKKNTPKADAENTLEQTQLVPENDGVCEAKALTSAVRQQKPQGNVFIQQCPATSPV